MTAESFRAKRRQKFLTEQYFELNIAHLLKSNRADARGLSNRLARGNLDPVSQGGIFRDRLSLLELHYTAGCPIEELRPLFADVLTALGEWNDADRVYVKSLDPTGNKDLRTDTTPLEFEELSYFQIAIEVVSLGALLGDGAALRKIATWLEMYRGTDILFEFLLSPAVPDPRDNTDFFHVRPYDPLIDAFYTAETAQASSAFVKKYLEGWYKSFEGVPWHNGHLKGGDDFMPYYGYWSFEAAAVCLIHGIDDSSFREHLVYPKDLADWAHANHSLARLKTGAAPEPSESQAPLRCPAGQACPRVGWWSTPARSDSRSRFSFGQVMPEIGGDYGATIWQWDEQQ